MNDLLMEKYVDIKCNYIVLKYKKYNVQRLVEIQLIIPCIMQILV